MDNQLNFDAEVLTSEVMQNLNVAIATKKNSKVSTKTLNESKLVTNVKVSDLIIDLSYQRKPNQIKVAKIIKDFDPNALGVIICSIRENGVIAVIDGGHRISALNAMGMHNSDVRCLVFFGLSLSQEAEMFATLNDNRTKPKTQDIFKSKVIAKDETAIDIDNVIKKYGLSISNAPSMNGIRAIGTVTNIYKKYGVDVLDKTIMCLTEAFDKHSTSFSDQALLAVSSIIAQSKDIDLKRMISILSTYGTANLWFGKGSSVAKQANFKKNYHGMIFVFVNDYNKRLKKNKIDFSKVVI